LGGVRPFELGPNRLRRFYEGGARIAAFRGGDGDGPEDWIASTTAAFGEAELGPSRLAGGELLGDVLAAEPEAFFEPVHLAAHGAEPALLLKLLDAGQRLPVHFHPDGSFAREQLGVPRGKTEAWVILDAEPGATLHLGFSRDVEADELAHWVAAQDVEAMIGSMNRLPAGAGDALFVPAGLAHVLGEGILLLELQEPSDLSLLLEWRGVVDSEREAFLGLPVKLALSAARRTRVTPDELAHLASSRGRSLFPAEADAFFRADLVAAGDVLEPGFSVVVVTDGDGELGGLPVRRGSTVLVPFAAGACELTGSLQAIRCRPPALAA
jgi:mannose-6-phosphate isomerase